MRTAKLGWVVVGVSSLLGLVACIQGESPIVGTEEETGGTGGSGAAGGTGGTGATGPDPVGSSNYYLTQLRAVANDQDASCMPRRLSVGDDGRVACTLSSIEPKFLGSDAACDCEAAGRTPVDEQRRTTVLQHLHEHGQCGVDQGLPDCETLCVCDVAQAEGADWTECEQNPTPSEDARGWCYVAPDQGVGVPALVDDCEREPKVRIRFLNETVLPTDALLVLGCLGETPLPPLDGGENAELGAPCLPDDEYQHTFSSFSPGEVTVVTGSQACASRVCVVNHFQGRASCPYGQTEIQAENDPQCFLPGSNVAVTVPVEPQLKDRRADSAAICSCRCDGPGDGPFCDCAEGMECARLIEPLGLPGDDALAGSYCIPQGTAFDATEPPFDFCQREQLDCGEPHPY